MSDISPVPSPPVQTATTSPVTPPTASTPPATTPAAPLPQQPGNQAGGQPLPNPQQQPAPASPGADPAAQISAALKELAQGGQITAQVVARDQAALLVRTAAGPTLALNNLATALEQANVAVLNAALKLQLNPANPNQVTVTNANGATLQPPLSAAAQPPTAAQMALAVAPPQQAGSSAPVVLPQPGQTLPATVTAPPPTPAAPAGAAATPTPAPTLPTGSQLQLVVKTVTLPAPPVVASPAQSAVPVIQTPQIPLAQAPTAPAVATPVAASATPTPPQPLAATSVALPSTASAVAPPAASLAGASPPPPASVTENRTMLAAQLAARSPQPAMPPNPPMPPQTPGVQAMPTQIAGIVTGQGQAGQVLVSTPQGVLSLSLPQPLPPGTQISFELSALMRPPGASPSQVGPAPLAGVLTRLQGEWPVLQQTLDAVRAADPALAQRLQAELLPQPNARLASTALQFMAAAAIGSAQAWLGAEAVRKLEQSGKGDLVRKLDEDFRELGRLNQRQGDNDWQALVMPMLVGGRIEPIQIFMRRRRDPKRQQQQTRFIIDFDLESTGPIQFDGFVGQKQLDLILRSETEFGPAFRLDVTEIFTNALEITGMTGSIRFHDREKPLTWPSPELEAAGPSTEVKV